MFVGREAELAELRHGLERSLAGRGALYLVYGEPGIGKTRLCDEVAGYAATRGAALFWGRCWEAFEAPAYWPWLDVLSALCRELDAETLDQTLGEGRAALSAILPDLRGRGSDAAPATQPAHDARLQLFRSVHALLRRVASTRGLVLVLEDLHAADESSLLLLHFVARELRSMRVFVLVTFRDVEAQLSAQVGEAIGRLTREGTSMSLGRLSRAEAEQLLRARAAGLADGELAAVYGRTQGNPLFLQELAALCLSQGSAALAAGKLPQSVREVLRERLGRTAENVRDALEMAAIGGDVIDPPLLAAALGLALPELQQRLSLAESRGVIVRRTAGGFSFFHALAREVLEQDLSAERRRELHAALARALAPGRASSPELEPRYLELAHHWLEAGSAALPEALRCALCAADQAIARFAFEEAVSVLERAHAAVQAVPGAVNLRAEVLLALGRAQIQRGAGGVGQALCLEAAALAREQEDPELLARAALAFGLEIKAAVIDPALIALLKEAFAALPEHDSPLRVQIMARLAAAMQPHHDLQYPIGLAEAAIAAARRIGDPPTLLYALTTGMSAMMDIVDPKQRLPLNLEAEQLAQTAGDRERVLRSLVRLTFDHLELGDLPAADAHIAHFERVTHEAKAARYAWRVPLFHSMRAMMHGRFHEAEDLLERAHVLGTHAEDPQLSRCYAFHREGLLRAWERHEEMAAFDLSVRPLRAAFYSGPHWQNGGSAFTYSRLEADAQTRMYLDLIPQDDWPLVHNPPAFAHLGEPLALCGDEPLVRRVYALLLPAAHRCVSWGFTKFVWDGTATRVLGLLAARLGRYDEAEAHFGAALGQLERLDAKVYLVRTRYEYARALLGLARPADRDRALRLIESALEGARALDMRGLCRLAERQLAAAASAPLPPGAAEAPSSIAAASVALPLPQPAPADAPSPTATQPSGRCLELGFSFACEGEFWTVTHAAGSFRLRDSLGLHYLTRLFGEPDRPIHVLALAAGDARAESAALSSGDAGELLDERAVQSYRRRAQLLEAELAEAEAWNDAARAARAREELEFLQAELARAVGLGGRVRRASSSSERARSAVQRRIRNVLERVRSCAPELAEILDGTVKTGTYCVFRPGDARPAGPINPPR